jgi:hypothetical protein
MPSHLLFIHRYDFLYLFAGDVIPVDLRLVGVVFGCLFREMFVNSKNRKTTLSEITEWSLVHDAGMFWCLDVIRTRSLTFCSLLNIYLIEERCVNLEAAF